MRTITINAYERNPTARSRCIAHWGAICSVCSFDFGRVYGPDLAGFIHIHHVVPLSAIRNVYELDPIRDLRPVCPNCHAAIHHSRFTPLTIEELRARLRPTS
jgi:5-methylcytosine-specific restriction protein A